MKKIFSVLLLGTALTFSTACKKDEKKDADKTDKTDKADKGAKVDDKGAAPAFDTVGAAECDELVKRTRCSFEKAGAAMPPESKKAFEDGVGMWRDNLKNDATRQATIDACKMSIDAGKDGWTAQGC